MEWLAGLVLWSVAGTMYAMARQGRREAEKMRVRKEEGRRVEANQRKFQADW